MRFLFQQHNQNIAGVNVVIDCLCPFDPALIFEFLGINEHVISKCVLELRRQIIPLFLTERNIPVTTENFDIFGVMRIGHNVWWLTQIDRLMSCS